MARFDVVVTQWLQTHGTEQGEAVYRALSLLGGPVLFVAIAIVAIAFIVRRDWPRFVTLAVTCGGGAILDVTLKSIFHRARPSFASEFNETSWSFPSGHAMDSLIGYGLFAYWLAERFPRARVPILIFAAVLVVVIGYARVYLGVHYLSDVVGGYMAGLIWLSVCAVGYRAWGKRTEVGARAS